MPQRDNKRILYANQQVGVKADGGSTFTTVFGAQDVSLSTNFNLTQFFELGQLQIYQNLEELPDVEVSIPKIFDGKPLVWHLATQGASSPTLAGRSNEKAVVALSIFPDTNDSATGTPPSIVECSGLFPSSLSYEFSVGGGAFTENVTLVGNDKIWKDDPKILNTADIARSQALSFDGDAAFASNNDGPAIEGIQRKEDLVFDVTATTLDVNGMAADSNSTILPPEVDGISTSGTNDKFDGSNFDAHIQSITVSTDLGRETIDELGRRGPYHRFVTFPTEVTCAIEVISTSGDMISATENGIYSTGSGSCSDASNLKDRTIRIATCNGVRLYLGVNNRLSSIDYGGGTTDGGNATATYNFSTFNDLTVLDENDPNTNSAAWWAARDTYLLNT